MFIQSLVEARKTNKHMHILWDKVHHNYELLKPTKGGYSRDGNDSKRDQALFYITVLKQYIDEYEVYVKERDVNKYLVHRLQVYWGLDTRSQFVRIILPPILFILSLIMCWYAVVMFYNNKYHRPEEFDADKFKKNNFTKQKLKKLSGDELGDIIDTANAKFNQVPRFVFRVLKHNKLRTLAVSMVVCALVINIWVWGTSDFLTQAGSPEWD
mgnify:CR=1 FL=1